MTEVGSDRAVRPSETLRVPPEIVKQLRALAALEWGKKRIARALGISRNSVRVICARAPLRTHRRVRPLGCSTLLSKRGV